ncbi:hypothetical protein QLX08_007541 [Tetragonisca angustula]|uniref:Uncharacterized protein n=1 Tax=Tetragonisca angustula TaxID=166442 RepID=A0AAW0ZP21_9HYME
MLNLSIISVFVIRSTNIFKDFRQLSKILCQLEVLSTGCFLIFPSNECSVSTIALKCPGNFNQDGTIFKDFDNFRKFFHKHPLTGEAAQKKKDEKFREITVPSVAQIFPRSFKLEVVRMKTKMSCVAVLL